MTTMLPVETREVACSSCGAINRVVSYSIEQLPRCGKCQSRLPETFVKKTGRFVINHGRLTGLMVMLIAVGIFYPKVLLDLPSNILRSFAAAEGQGQKQALPSCAPRERPLTGTRRVHDNSEQVAPLTIRTSSGGDYYIKLQEAGTSRPVMTLYVRGGETIQRDVPAGAVVIKYAFGQQWCGAADLFGSDTVLSQADTVLQFTEGSGYIVELIAQRGGNLKTRSIDRSQF